MGYHVIDADENTGEILTDIYTDAKGEVLSEMPEIVTCPDISAFAGCNQSEVPTPTPTPANSICYIPTGSTDTPISGWSLATVLEGNITISIWSADGTPVNPSTVTIVNCC